MAKKKLLSFNFGYALLLFVLLMPRHLFPANNPAYTARQQAYIDSALANFNGSAITIQAYKGVPVDSATLANMLAGVATGATSDFEYEQLVRILYFAPGVYDSLIMPVLRKVHYWINYDDTLDCYWSENHMAQWMSSHWLLHEKYGIAPDSNLRPRLIHYLQMKIAYNYHEFFSTTYNPYCLAGLLNLADFSQDTVVKNLATTAAQVLMKDMVMLLNDQGVLYPTAGRNYPGHYDGPYGANINSPLWLLTGIGPMPIGASHSGGFLSTSPIAVDAVTQSWQPLMDTTFIMGNLTRDQAYAYNSSLDSLDRIIFQWSAGAYFNPQFAVESFSLISDSDLWHNVVFTEFEPLSSLPPADAYSISEGLYAASYSSMLYSDTIVAFKHNSITLSSVQDYWPGYWGYQQYPCVANVGTTAVYTASGKVVPNWDNRSADNGNDDLPYVKQVHNVALEMYRPLPKSTILGPSDSTVSLHWFNQDFTEIRSDSLWLLGRVGNNYVGVRRHCLNQIDSIWACDAGLPDGQAWVIIVGDSAMYGSFNAFQTIIDSSKFTEQWYYDTAAQQSVFYASVTIDTITISHEWGVDEALPSAIANLPGNTPNFLVFPNPAKDEINFSVANAEPGETFAIYNMLGQLICIRPITNKLSSINVSQFSEGLYVVKVSAPGGELTRTFVVSH
jgi:Secretion system C-terminal sorting domain